MCDSPAPVRKRVVRRGVILSSVTCGGSPEEGRRSVRHPGLRGVPGTDRTETPPRVHSVLGPLCVLGLSRSSGGPSGYENPTPNLPGSETSTTGADDRYNPTDRARWTNVRSPNSDIKEVQDTTSPEGLGDLP